MNRALSAVRYASGTTGVNFEKWLTWAAIGGVAYFAYSIYRGATEARDKAAEAIANGYVALTAGPAIEVLGRVVLPDGQRVPLNGLAVKSDFTFTYQGKRFKLTKRRPDNDYDAVAA